MNDYQYVWICELCDFIVKDSNPNHELLIASHTHQLIKCKNLNYTEHLSEGVK